MVIACENEGVVPIMYITESLNVNVTKKSIGTGALGLRTLYQALSIHLSEFVELEVKWIGVPWTINSNCKQPHSFDFDGGDS